MSVKGVNSGDNTNNNYSTDKKTEEDQQVANGPEQVIFLNQTYNENNNSGISDKAKTAVSNVQKNRTNKSLDSGTNSGSLIVSVAVGEQTAAMASFAAKLSNGDPSAVKNVIEVAFSEKVTAIASSLGVRNLGNNTTEAAKRLDARIEDVIPIQAQRMTMETAKAAFNNDMSVLKGANGSLYTATLNYKNAVSQYGSDSQEAQTVKSQISQFNDLINAVSIDAAKQTFIAQALAGKYPDNEDFQKVSSSMTSQYIMESNITAVNTTASAETLDSSDTSSDSESVVNTTDSTETVDSSGSSGLNIFAGYNSAALRATSSQSAVIAAMLFMSDITDRIAQQQSSVQQGMQEMQSNLSNTLQSQLNEQNPFLDQLTRLGKKQAKASKRSVGIFAAPGNFYNGTFGSIDTSKPGGYNSDKSTRAWEGLGETFGFVSPSKDVSGEMTATNARIVQLNSQSQIGMQKVSNITSSINAQNLLTSSSAQSVQGLNDIMSSSIKMWASAISQAISSGAA